GRAGVGVGNRVEGRGADTADALVADEVALSEADVVHVRCGADALHLEGAQVAADGTVIRHEAELLTLDGLAPDDEHVALPRTFKTAASLFEHPGAVHLPGSHL